MLAPDSRKLLLDALRPPPGHSLDRAVATTFTLDLATALMVPLAFAGFRFADQLDPIEVMEALRGMGDRLDVFCQAGAINAGAWPSDLMALLENVIHEVRRPRPGHIFHPKVWVLRFVDQLQEPSYRCLVLSRNLTADRSWDTLLWLDGWPQRRRIADNAPLSRFVSTLSELAVTQLPPARRAARRGAEAGSMGPAGRRSRGSLPSHRTSTFATVYGRRTFQRLSEACDLTVRPRRRAWASPPAGAGQKAVLVSRGEELHALQPITLDNLDVFELDPTASLSADDIEEDRSQAFLTHLHAKVFVVERARLAHLFVGSANATDGGLGGNIEFLCELIGPVAKYGVDALVGEDAPFRAMLTPYVASERSDIDEASKAGRALQDLLIDIAEKVRFRTTVTRRADGWMPRVTADTALPDTPESTCVTIAPHNRPAETRLLNPAEPTNFELPARELADVTPFLQLTAHRTVKGVVVERSAVICSQLDGAPDDRFQEIMARQIDTPEKFLRLLALLMGLASGSGGGFAATGFGPGSWSAGAGHGVLELLARALSETPDSIDHLEPIVERLRRMPNGGVILPPGWDDVWLPVLAARRSMLEVHQ